MSLRQSTKKQARYMAWLGQTTIPKLLLHAGPGVLIPPQAAAAYRERLPNTETANVAEGLHYLPED